MHTSALGALLTFSSRPWYARYVASGGGTLTPLEDQQLAGLIMWVPGGVVLLAAALALVAVMLRDAERRAPRRLRLPAPHAAALLAALVMTAGVLAGGSGHDATAKIMTGGDPGQGRVAIRKYGCQTCHTIPGVPGANAVVGPPLTQLGGRAYVAGGSNTPDRLVQWIQHPQHLRSALPDARDGSHRWRRRRHRGLSLHAALTAPTLQRMVAGPRRPRGAGPDHE